MGRTSKPYVFTGTERAVTDGPRFQRALQTWDGYVRQQRVEEEMRERLRHERQRG